MTQATKTQIQRQAERDEVDHFAGVRVWNPYCRITSTAAHDEWQAAFDAAKDARFRAAIAAAVRLKGRA